MARVVATECRGSAPDRRPWAGALTAALLGATAVVVALAAAVLAEPVPAEDPGHSAETLVRRYYAAVNIALATGDLAMLEEIVAADARVVPESVEPAVMRATLASNLAALRASHPDLRLRVGRLIASRDEAVAWVTFEGDAGAVPVVAPITGRESGLLDGFRVRDGRIVEVRGATPGLSAPTPMIRTDLDTGRGPVLIGLVHIEVAPDAAVPVLSGPGPAAMAVERGRLQVRLDGSGTVSRSLSEGTTALGQTVTRGPASLGPGDQLAVAAAVPIRMQNDGDEPASVLLAVIFPLATTNTPGFHNAGLEVRSLLVEAVRAPNGVPDYLWPHGVTVRRLAGEILTAVPSGPARIEAGRMVLAPGMAVAEWRPAGQVLLAVEHGEVLITAAPADRGDKARPAIVTGNGEAFAIPMGAGVSVRGSGDDPAVLILSRSRTSSRHGSGSVHPGVLL